MKEKEVCNGRKNGEQLAIIVAVLLMACSIACNPPAPRPDVLFPVVENPMEWTRSRNLHAKVYLDATPSMQGFVGSGVTGQYAMFLQELGLALERAWRNPKVEYFKFGTIIEQIKPHPAFQSAWSTGFYGSGPGYQDTRIDRVLDEVSGKALTLIVTDMFQQDADVAALVSRIRAKVLSAHLGLGLLGVKADFRGTIYDVGIQRLSFPYNSESTPGKYRPFFVLMIGTSADIVHFVEQLKAVTELAKMENLLIVAPSPVRAALDWQNTTVEKYSGVRPEAKVVEAERRGTPAFSLTKRFFSWAGSSVNDISIAVSTPYYPVPYSPRLQFSKLGPPQVKTKLWTKPLWGKAAQRGLAKSAAPREEWFRMSNESRGLATLRVVFPPKALALHGTYVFSITPVLRPDMFELPAFCSAWSMSAAEGTSYARNSSQAFDGTRAQNLHLFITSVWTASFEEHKPSLGTLYLYLRK